MTRPVVLRDREASGATPVTAMELFFDLVYVFAVTQLSHHLLEHLTARGAVQTAVLFLGVWWAWNYTAWATNWIDPDRPVVRALLLVLMLLVPRGCDAPQRRAAARVVRDRRRPVDRRRVRRR